MKYWHELTEEEVQAVYDKGTTVGEVLKEYKQPDWCDYPDALAGRMGCWSLTGSNRKDISLEFCSSCDLCNVKDEIQPEAQQPQ
jgi:hypothetical protein